MSGRCYLNIPPVSGGFTPQPGYTYTATTIADGVQFTITKIGGGFGTKPVSAKPLLWMDGQSVTPSPLGRTTALQSVSNLSFVASGGPAGGGYIQGAPVVSGDTGTQKTWAAALDVDQWGTATPSAAINDYGSKYYLWRTEFKNFGHYDEKTAPNPPDNYNIKNWRIYARNPDTLNSPQAQPDAYMSTSNQRLTQEGSSNTPNQDFTRPGQPGGSADAVASANIIAFDGGLPGSPDPVTFGNWFSSEFVTRSNLADPGLTPPTPDNTSVLWQWYIEGKLSNQAAFPTPVFTYQWNQWYWKAVSMPSLGRIMRYIFWQYIVDGTGGRLMVPVASYVGYGPTVVEDSWCRAHIRNRASRAAFTINEYQPPSAWSDTDITITLRKGRLGTYSSNALIVTDNNGVEYYTGTFN